MVETLIFFSLNVSFNFVQMCVDGMECVREYSSSNCVCFYDGGG